MKLRFLAMIGSFFGVGPTLFTAIFVVLLLGGRSSFFQDPGTFWHTRTGFQILQTHSLISTDPYTYTHFGKPWTPFEWLGEVGMSLIYSCGGFDLMLLSTVVFVSALFAFLGNRIARCGLNWAVVACLTGLALAVASNHFHIRPHLMTMLGMAVIMVHCSRIENGKSSIVSSLWFVSLFVLWANIHGGAAGGIATLAVIFTGWIGSWLMAWESPVKTASDAVVLIAIGLLIGLTPLVNPYGIALPKTWFAIMSMPEVKQVIVEHFPINWQDPKNVPFFLMGAIYLFLLCGLRRVPRMTWLIPVIWFALGCDRVRHSSLFGIVAFAAIADLFPFTRWADYLAAKRPDFYTRVKSHLPFNRRHFLLPMIVISCLILAFSRQQVEHIGSGIAQIDTEKWPMQLLHTIHKSSELGNRRIFHEINQGGFLIWFTPEYRTFMDDRCELFGGAKLKEMVDAERGGVESALNYLTEKQIEYGPFDHALTRIGSGFDEVFRTQSETWQLIKESSHHAFYCRKKLVKYQQ